MLRRLYSKWMFAWETALTTRDTNRIVRPLEWGFDWVPIPGVQPGRSLGAPGLASGTWVSQESRTPFAAPLAISGSPPDPNPAEPGLAHMIALSAALAADSDAFFAYRTPTDFRLERRHPQLFPTNVRPETLRQDADLKRQAASGELAKAEFLRFTSPVRTPYPENDQVNARWYPASAEQEARFRRLGKPRQALIVMPQWNADAFSHNALCEIFNRFGVSCLRLSKPYHDIRRPAELERSDYAVSSNIGRTMNACQQAVTDIRSCVDWLAGQGYEQFGVMGTSLGSCYAFIAAAHDPRLQVVAANHASTWFGDVVWTGQSTRHIREAFENAGLSQDDVRKIFLAISPMAYMDRFCATAKEVLIVHATYDLTFLEEFSQDVLRNFDRRGFRYTARTLPCGHYTTGETPYKYLDAWYLGKFIHDAYKRLAFANLKPYA